MTPLYLIFLPDGSQDGPFSEADLLDLLDADEVGAGTLCENLQTHARCRLRDLFKVIPPPPHPTPNTPARWIHAPLPAPDPPAIPPPAPQRTLYFGHPSLWLYWRSLLLSATLLAAAWCLGHWPNLGPWLVASYLAGGSCLALTLLRRSSVQYRITTRRIEVQRGLFSQSSQEIRIPDIRALNVHQSGFRGLLGIGDLTFSAASGPADDLAFLQTPRAHPLKQMVRHLQDRAP